MWTPAQVPSSHLKSVLRKGARGDESELMVKDVASQSLLL